MFLRLIEVRFVDIDITHRPPQKTSLKSNKRCLQMNNIHLALVPGREILQTMLD